MFHLRTDQGNFHDQYKLERAFSEGINTVICTHMATNGRYRIKRILKREIQDLNILILYLNKWKEIKYSDVLQLFEIFEDAESLFLILENCIGNIFEILEFYDYISENLVASFFEKILLSIEYLCN